MSSKNDNEQNDALPDGLSKNVLDHFLGDDVLLLSVWWSLKKLWLWSLSGEGKGSEGVHDQVYPKELDSS